MKYTKREQVLYGKDLSVTGMGYARMHHSTFYNMTFHVMSCSHGCLPLSTQKEFV